jgi:hypothetical protein
VARLFLTQAESGEMKVVRLQENGGLQDSSFKIRVSGIELSGIELSGLSFQVRASTFECFKFQLFICNAAAVANSLWFSHGIFARRVCKMVT